MNYTDTQLKQALARLLPGVVNRITLHTCDGDKEEHLFFRNRPQFYVQDSELLYLCWLVEETLGIVGRMEMRRALVEHIQQYPNNECAVGYGERVCHATWQQRVQALAAVKGISL